LRFYIETTIIADWLFFHTIKPSNRKRLRRSVRSSYRLVEKIIDYKVRSRNFVTSNWAILEAIGSVKRSRTQFNMLTQNISFGYYDDVKDQKGFRLERHQISEIHRLAERLRHRKAVRWSALRWSRAPIVFEDAVFFIMLGLDAPDAVHAAIATAEGCNVLVTRDGDFLKRKKTLQPYFQVVEPFEALKLLKRSREPLTTRIQLGG